MARLGKYRDAAARRSAEEAGHALAEGWGCPAAGHAPRPLQTLHRRIAEATAETTGTACTGTCPLAPLYRPNPWVGKITSAVMLHQRMGRPIEKTLARGTPDGEPYRCDQLALFALAYAQAGAEEADRERWEDERKRRAAGTTAEG